MSIWRIVFAIHGRICHLFRRIQAHVEINRLRCLGVEIGTGVTIYGRPIVSMAFNSRISIGNNVVICSDSRMTALGVTRPVVLRTLMGGAEIVIGDDVGISGAVICSSTTVFIGSNTLLGANVTICDTDFHPLSARGRRHDEFNIKSSPVVLEAYSNSTENS